MKILTVFCFIHFLYIFNKQGIKGHEGWSRDQEKPYPTSLTPPHQKKYCLDEECCSMVGGKKPLGNKWPRNISFQFWSHSQKRGGMPLSAQKNSLMSTLWKPKPRRSLWQKSISPQRQIFEIPFPVYHIW